MVDCVLGYFIDFMFCSGIVNGIVNISVAFVVLVILVVGSDVVNVVFVVLLVVLIFVDGCELILV